MHKSTIRTTTFVLLASSLVMLVVLPLLSSNNNAVMAQGYYGDDSYYSQYPTDDKKYECKTGPFEGFFVSSVEFCKHVKFDDKKDRDIKVGPQGPAGPQGIQGIQGPIGPNGTQGPLGPTQINSSSVYFAGGESGNTSGTGLAFSEALCDPGDIVLSGSYVITNVGNTGFISDSASSGDNGWEATASGPDTPPDATVGIRAFAHCFDNPPLR
jgi:hypothetical protein